MINIVRGVDTFEIILSFYEVFWKSSSPRTVPVHRGSPGKKTYFLGADRVH